MAELIAAVASVVPFPYVVALMVAQIVIRLGIPPGTPARLQSILRLEGMISPKTTGSGVTADTPVDLVDTFPAASYASMEYVYDVLAESPVFWYVTPEVTVATCTPPL